MKNYLNDAELLSSPSDIPKEPHNDSESTPNKKKDRKPSPIKLPVFLKIANEKYFKTFRLNQNDILDSLSGIEQKATLSHFRKLIQEMAISGEDKKASLKKVLGQNKRLKRVLKLPPAVLEEIVTRIYENSSVAFEIKLLPNQWGKFVQYYLSCPDDFLEQFSIQIKEQIVDKTIAEDERQKPTWGNRKTADITTYLKGESEYLYILFSILSGISLKETPAWFQTLLKKYESDKDNVLEPELLTAYCIMEANAQTLEKHALKKHFDVRAAGYHRKNLRRTYIFNKDGKHLRDIMEGLKQKMTKEFRNAQRNGAAKYLRKKTDKFVYAYADGIALRDDMYPCDKNGKLLHQDQVSGKIRTSLIEKIFNPSGSFTLQSLIKS